MRARRHVDGMRFQLYNVVTENLPMKKLTKHGNSLALVIDKPILDLLKMDADTPLEITTDGDVLIVKPQRKRRDRKQLREALAWVNDNYGGALKRLAE